MTLTNYKKYPKDDKANTYLKTRFPEGIHALIFRVCPSLSAKPWATTGLPFWLMTPLQSTRNTMGQRSNVCETEMCVATTRLNLGQFLCLEITEILFQ